MAESASSLPSQAVGRPPVKQRAIVDMLHRQIIQGVLAPGSKLPTRRDLVAQFGGSFLSVQQALDQLVGEGFVEARGPAGTFVSQRPPHLHDYALIFPQLPSHPGFRRFWTALSNEAERLNQVSGSSRHITAWYGIDGHADNEDFQRLVALVKRRQLAGLIFASSPFLVANTSLLDQPGIPRAAIGEPRKEYADITMISPDPLSFLNRAIEYLASRGRRRVALISAAGLKSSWDAKAARLLRLHRMSTRPYWNLHIDPAMGQAVRNIAHLLMHAGQDQRPDALIIADDNLVEPVTAGLVDAGVSVPDELDVVAHCNFPWPTPSIVPVCRLGFDAGEVLAVCLRAVNRHGAAKASHRPIRIKARFESELSISQEVCK